ncbi:MAG: sulfotransferase domain-containing protein [Chloroflexia bacterium]|nr:sulfotransferase domain-containing protein [Chloroflexia bacterium]
MRIVIASPPKAGNRWLKCLLRHIYDLESLHGDKKPPTQPREFQEWAERGFPDGTIFHQHCQFSPALCDVIDAVPAHLVTIIRDPYDVFVSLYYWVQEQATHRQGRGKPRPKNGIAGKPLDHPDVLAFLAGDFSTNVMRAEGWRHSGRTVVVRYEELHRDPVAELTRATEAIAPVEPERIARATEVCRAENMRQSGQKKQWQVSATQVGETREGLGAAHLAVFRDRYADVIRSLDYEVR